MESLFFELGANSSRPTSREKPSRFQQKESFYRTFWQNFTVKCVQIRSFFFGPYFLAVGLNTERYEVSLRIHSECGKIWTRKNSVFGHFLCSASSGDMVWKKVSMLLYKIIFFWLFSIFILGIYPSPPTHPHPASTSPTCFMVSPSV